MICKVCNYRIRKRWLRWRHVGQDWREFGWHRVKPGIGPVRLTRDEHQRIAKMLARGVDRSAE